MKCVRFVVVLLSFCVTFGLAAQSYSKNSIKLGTGFAISVLDYSAFGTFASVGFQREIWKDRLRFNPNLSVASYSAQFIMDSGDRFYNSTNLEANLYYDLVKISSLSLQTGLGALVNAAHGYDSYDGYFYDFNLAGYLGIGLRYNSPRKNWALNVMPYNYYFGPNDFMHAMSKIELDIKFR